MTFCCPLLPFAAHYCLVLLPNVFFCCPLLPFAAAQCWFLLPIVAFAAAHFCLLLLPNIAFCKLPLMSSAIVVSCQALLHIAATPATLSSLPTSSWFLFADGRCLIDSLHFLSAIQGHTAFIHAYVGVRCSITIGCTRQSLLPWYSQPCCSHSLPSAAAAALHSICSTSYTWCL